jgi:hypothetical protein
LDPSQPTITVKGFTLSPELFSRGYMEGMSPCTCSSTCCGGGVYVDLTERERILGQRERIKKYMDETQSTDEANWFDHDVEDDPDFPSGKCVGTQVINDKCAFLDRQGRCSIQVAATAEGLHRWAWKPLYCILFPIEISDRVISFDDMLQDQQPCCSVRNEFDVPLFEACRDELVHLLGEDGFSEIRNQYRALAK